MEATPPADGVVEEAVEEEEEEEGEAASKDRRMRERVESKSKPE